MKDIFDKCKFGEFNLNSRIIRTGAWERQTEDGGFLSEEVFDRYEKMAKSGVGLILSEMFAFDNQKAEPNDLTIEGIRKLQAEVIMVAKKFSFAGFDGIQINMGNNFYLSRFTNPYFNQREDEYGGNTLNRLRIVLEIIQLIKKSIGFHVSCRINIEDVRNGGLTQEESMKMAKLLDTRYSCRQFKRHENNEQHIKLFKC